MPVHRWQSRVGCTAIPPDHTAARTAALMRRLLAAHANRLMSIEFRPQGPLPAAAPTDAPPTPGTFCSPATLRPCARAFARARMPDGGFRKIFLRIAAAADAGDALRDADAGRGDQRRLDRFNQAGAQSADKRVPARHTRLSCTASRRRTPAAEPAARPQASSCRHCPGGTPARRRKARVNALAPE